MVLRDGSLSMFHLQQASVRMLVALNNSLTSEDESVFNFMNLPVSTSLVGGDRRNYLVQNPTPLSQLELFCSSLAGARFSSVCLALSSIQLLLQVLCMGFRCRLFFSFTIRGYLQLNRA